MNMERYYLEGLELTVDETLFLVQVRYAPSVVRDAEHSVSQLPAWIFTPRLAVWLMRDGSSIRERAQQGEAIRKAMTERRGQMPAAARPA